MLLRVSTCAIPEPSNRLQDSEPVLRRAKVVHRDIKSDNVLLVQAPYTYDSPYYVRAVINFFKTVRS